MRPDKVHTSHGERLYRTGDCGYLLADGCLEIHGRMDTMVKVRGYSVEVQVTLISCYCRTHEFRSA